MCTILLCVPLKHTNSHFLPYVYQSVLMYDVTETVYACMYCTVVYYCLHDEIALPVRKSFKESDCVCVTRLLLNVNVFVSTYASYYNSFCTRLGRTNENSSMMKSVFFFLSQRRLLNVCTKAHHKKVQHHKT